VIRLPAAKHKEFDQFSPKGKEFTKIWNNAYRNGIQQKLAAHFGMSTYTVYRIRKKLGLAHLHDLKNHPGKKKFYKRVKKLYLIKDRSTLQIAKIVRMSDQQINNILKEQNVTLRPQYITDPRYQPTTSHLSPHQFLKEIKRLYEDEKLSATAIAKKLGVDPRTVCKRLKAINIELRQHHNKVMPGGYRCQWCAQVMEKVYHNAGPRKQLYCSSTCGNKAKDYRRMQRGIRLSTTRMQTMETFLKTAWKMEYQTAIKKIMSPRSFFKSRNSNGVMKNKT
jgi:hypothetical protein